MRTIKYKTAVFFAFVASTFFLSPSAWAHCDTMDGPVIADARLSLEAGDPARVLKWVSPENESQIRLAFEQTLRVRKTGGESKDLADRYFFETLVRVHRAGEGEPFTGLKESTSVDEGILAADHALAGGDGMELASELSDKISAQILSRLEHAIAARQHAEHTVDMGRKYVEAYVQFIHYVEAVHKLAEGQTTHGESEPPQESHSKHQH